MTPDSDQPPSDTHNPASGPVLGIETSTPWGGAALIDAHGRLISHAWGHARTGYSRRLMPTIDALLSRSDLRPANLAAIAVTHGPGSFTGVRIGLVTAKTLAQSLGIPLFTFPTLESLASRWPVRNATIAVMLDARRKEVYSAVYRIHADRSLESLRAEQVEPPTDFLNALSSLEPGPLWLAGDAVEKNRPLWQEALGDRAREIGMPLGVPAAESVARLGFHALRTGVPPSDPLLAVPQYLRLSDAHKIVKA